MNPRNKAIALATVGLMSFVGLREGREYVVYQDVNHVATVCDGITGPEVIAGKVYTDAECDALKQKAIVKHGSGVLQCVTVEISQSEYEAYTSFAYNVGVSAFCKSTMLRKLNAGDHLGACNEFPKWIYAGGRRYRGLEHRRAAERELCMKGLI